MHGGMSRYVLVVCLMGLALAVGPWCTSACAQSPSKDTAITTASTGTIPVAEFDARLRKADGAFRRGQQEMGFHNNATAKSFLEYAAEHYSKLLGIAESGSKDQRDDRVLWVDRAKQLRKKAYAANHLLGSITPGQVQKQKARDTIDWTQLTYDHVRKLTSKAIGKTVSWNVMIKGREGGAFWAGIDETAPHVWAWAMDTKLPGDNAKVQIIFDPELSPSVLEQIRARPMDTKVRISGKIVDVVANVVVISITRFETL